MSQDEAVNEKVAADTTPTESAPVEEKSEAVEDAFVQGMNSDVDPEDMSSEETEGEVEEAPAEPEQAEETKPAQEDKQEDKAEWESLSGKAQERFRQKANEARELRERLAALEARKTQVATEQELLNQVNPETGDYYTVAEAERVARTQANEKYQQRLASEEYGLKVQQNQQTLASEASQAVTEFPELDAHSDKYDPELAQVYDQALSQALILDQQNNPIGAYMSPYQLAKSIVSPSRRAADRAKTLGQAEAQKATAKMLANADAAPSSSGAQPKGKEDPFLAGFNSAEY